MGDVKAAAAAEGANFSQPGFLPHFWGGRGGAKKSSSPSFLGVCFALFSPGLIMKVPCAHLMETRKEFHGCVHMATKILLPRRGKTWSCVHGGNIYVSNLREGGEASCPPYVCTQSGGDQGSKHTLSIYSIATSKN